MPWKKGQSGNPGGKPKKVREVEELARKVLEQDGRNLAFDALEQIVRTSEDEKSRIKACELVMAYAYGKPRQRTELSLDADTMPQIQIYLPDNKRGQ